MHRRSFNQCIAIFVLLIASATSVFYIVKFFRLSVVDLQLVPEVALHTHKHQDIAHKNYLSVYGLPINKQIKADVIRALNFSLFTGPLVAPARRGRCQRRAAALRAENGVTLPTMNRTVLGAVSERLERIIGESDTGVMMVCGVPDSTTVGLSVCDGIRKTYVVEPHRQGVPRCREVRRMMKKYGGITPRVTFICCANVSLSWSADLRDETLVSGLSGSSRGRPGLDVVARFLSGPATVALVDGRQAASCFPGMTDLPLEGTAVLVRDWAALGGPIRAEVLAEYSVVGRQNDLLTELRRKSRKVAK